jgi:hypothetical protein
VRSWQLTRGCGRIVNETAPTDIGFRGFRRRRARLSYDDIVLALHEPGPASAKNQCLAPTLQPHHQRGDTMADEVDLAFEAQERHLSMAIAAQRRAGSHRLQASGSCHWCGNVEQMGSRLFCDSECSRDWDREDSLRRKQGRPGLATMAHARADAVPGYALA